MYEEFVAVVLILFGSASRQLRSDSTKLDSAHWWESFVVVVWICCCSIWIYCWFRRFDLVVGGCAQIGCQFPVVSNTMLVTWWICRLLEMGGPHVYSSFSALSTARWQLAHIIGMVLVWRAMAVQTSSGTVQLLSMAVWMVMALIFGGSTGSPWSMMSMKCSIIEWHWFGVQYGIASLGSFLMYTSWVNLMRSFMRSSLGMTWRWLASKIGKFPSIVIWVSGFVFQDLLWQVTLDPEMLRIYGFRLEGLNCICFLAKCLNVRRSKEFLL